MARFELRISDFNASSNPHDRPADEHCDVTGKWKGPSRMFLIIRPPTAGDTDAVLRVNERAFAAARWIYRPNETAPANLTELTPRLE